MLGLRSATKMMERQISTSEGISHFNTFRVILRKSNILRTVVVAGYNKQGVWTFLKYIN